MSNVIKTIFEYTVTGYEEANKIQEETLQKAVALKKEEQELNKVRKETTASLEALIKVWERFNNVRKSGLTNEEREYFAQTKKDIDDLTKAQAKYTAQRNVWNFLNRRSHWKGKMPMPNCLSLRNV